MSWNYRIMRHAPKANEDAFYAVHEVIYDDNDDVKSWTHEPCGPSGETVGELSRDFAWIIKALSLPVLSHDSGKTVEPAMMLRDDLEKWFQAQYDAAKVIQ